MIFLLDAMAALFALASVLLVAYGAWLCLDLFQRDPKADGSAPTSVRKRLRSVSERFSASSK
jgi:uncharacterized membrane protein